LDVDAALMESLRRRLEITINEVTTRAYAAVGRAEASPVDAVLDV